MAEEKIEEIKNNDLSPALMARFTQPKKTWFIERLRDKFIFACEEVEAWKMLTNRGGWSLSGRDFRIVGVSDGKTYDKIVKGAKVKAEGIMGEIREIEAEANKYRKTEEKFVFEDLLDLTDPKVKKVKAIIAEYDKKLAKKNEEYFKMTRDVAKTAFDAELAVARKNPKEFPSNQDIITPGASPKRREKILRKMGGDLDD